jgi:hypothetical protein
LPRTMANWVILPVGEDEPTCLVVGQFSPKKTREVADLAVMEWKVTVSETGPWEDRT